MAGGTISTRTEEGEDTMRFEDMVFISVDDHVVEPPDMFEGRLPAKYADQAPKVVRNRDALMRIVEADS